MFGAKGVLETDYGGQVQIFGENPCEGGMTNPIFGEGALNNIAIFYKNITEGNYENVTRAPSILSNLVNIMGRNAAYEKKEVLWKDFIKSKERMEPNLKGLKT